MACLVLSILLVIYHKIKGSDDMYGFDPQDQPEDNKGYFESLKDEI